MSPRQNVTEDASKLNRHRRNAVGPARPGGLGKGAHPSGRPAFLRDPGNQTGASAMGLDGSSLDGSKLRQRTNRSGSFGDGPVQDTGRVGTVCQTLKLSGSWDQEKVRRSATAQGIPQVPGPIQCHTQCGGLTIIPALQVRKPSYQDTRTLTESHTAGKATFLYHQANDSTAAG